MEGKDGSDGVEETGQSGDLKEDLMMHVLIRDVDNERIQRRLFEIENLGFFQYHSNMEAMCVQEYVWRVCVCGGCVEGVCGGGCVWRRVCVEEGVCGGGCVWRRVCVKESVCGGGCVWRVCGGGCVWRRVCVEEGVCGGGCGGGCVWRRVCVEDVCGGCVWRVCVEGVCEEV